MNILTYTPVSFFATMGGSDLCQSQQTNGTIINNQLYSFYLNASRFEYRPLTRMQSNLETSLCDQSYTACFYDSYDTEDTSIVHT